MRNTTPKFNDRESAQREAERLTWKTGRAHLAIPVKDKWIVVDAS